MPRFLIFVTICLGLILVGINATAVSVAFPVITSSFHASLVEAGWVLSVYQLVSIAAMPLAGKASDIFGRKPVFMISLSFFVVGSGLCIIAPNIQLLIFFRLIQGIGGGAYFPVATGIVAETFLDKRQQFIGLTSSIYPIGQIIGPNLGGWLVTAFSWRSIFWFSAPFGVVILALSTFLPRLGERTKEPIDLAGAGFLICSIFAFLIGLTQLGRSESDYNGAYSGLLLLAGVGLMAVLIRHIGKARAAIIDLRVLREKPFLAVNIYNFVCGAFYFGISSFVPLYAVSIYNMSAIASGLVLTPWSVGVMIAAAVMSFFLVRWGYRQPLVISTCLVVVGLSVLAIESQGRNIPEVQLNSTALLLGTTFLLGIGTGIALPAANNACIELMPERVASITGVRSMFRNIGGALSITVISLLLTNISSIGRGFATAFFGLASVMLLTIPAIFSMPRGCQKPS